LSRDLTWHLRHVTGHLRTLKGGIRIGLYIWLLVLRAWRGPFVCRCASIGWRGAQVLKAAPLLLDELIDAAVIVSHYATPVDAADFSADHCFIIGLIIEFNSLRSCDF